MVVENEFFFGASKPLLIITLDELFLQIFPCFLLRFFLFIITIAYSTLAYSTLYRVSQKRKSL